MVRLEEIFRLRRLAKRCRKTLEAYAWNHDNNLAPWHRVPDLRGLCAIGSVYLCHQLQAKLGVEAFPMVGKFTENPQGKWWEQHRFSHAWCQTKSGVILDITASQFELDGEKLPPVLVLGENHRLRRHYLQGRPYTKPRSFHRWGEFQNPHYRKPKKRVSHLEELLSTT